MTPVRRGNAPASPSRARTTATRALRKCALLQPVFAAPSSIRTPAMTEFCAQRMMFARRGNVEGSLLCVQKIPPAHCMPARRPRESARQLFWTRFSATMGTPARRRTPAFKGHVKRRNSIAMMEMCAQMTCAFPFSPAYTTRIPVRVKMATFAPPMTHVLTGYAQLGRLRTAMTEVNALQTVAVQAKDAFMSGLPDPAMMEQSAPSAIHVSEGCARECLSIATMKTRVRTTPVMRKQDVFPSTIRTPVTMATRAQPTISARREPAMEVSSPGVMAPSAEIRSATLSKVKRARAATRTATPRGKEPVEKRAHPV